MAMRAPSGRMRRRTSMVIPPTPGPYSTITRARPQLMGSSSCLMRKRELGTIEPSMRGCLKKLRANSNTLPFGVRCRSSGLFCTLGPRAIHWHSTFYSNNSRRIPLRHLGRWPSTCPASAAGTARLVAKLAQLGHQPVAVLTLDLDDAVPGAATRAAEFLQPRRQLGERLLTEGQAADHRHAL